MATRKRSSRKQAAPRTSKSRPKIRRTTKSVKTKAGTTARGTMPIKERRRQAPETLRLRSYMPGLTVANLDRSIQFYTGPLGFIVGERWSEGGVVRGVSLKAGACQLGLSQDDWARGRDRRKGEGVRIWCETSQDIGALATRIKAAGERLVEDVTELQWGARSIAIDDPDGYHITIFQKK